MRLTTKQLAEIEARAEAATNGPWIAAARGSSVVGWPIVASTGRSICAINYVYHSAIDPALPGDKAFNAESKSNAAFIAHARQDIPALLSHVRAMEAKCVAILDQAWEAVNVLGAPDSAIPVGDLWTRGYCKAIGDALEEIEKLGGMQPEKRRS